MQIPMREQNTMKFLDKLSRAYGSYMTYLNRAKAREMLLRRTDRALEDAGFSRQLLESGVNAWPWQSSAVALAPLDFKQAGNVLAMHKLQSCTDSELHDLGISRGSIPHAVMFGRAGIGNKTANKNSERKVA